MLKKGDKVIVRSTAPHLKEIDGMEATVEEVSTPAIALKMSDGMIHYWAIEAELEKSKGGEMKSIKLGGYKLNINEFKNE